VVASCGPERIIVNAPPPPAEWLTCQPLPERPDLAPLQVITLDDGRRVYMKADVDARDVPIARYILDIRGSWFDCSNNLAQVRDYVEGVE
jgi:hypothetical protein